MDETGLTAAPPAERAAASKPAAPAGPVAEPRHIGDYLPVETWVAALTALLCIGLGVATPYFWTSGNIENLLLQVSIVAIITFGELFSIVLAGIDLSVGAVAALNSVIFAMLLAGGVPIVAAVAATLAIGLVIGLVNGAAIERLGIPAFIVTLAGLQGYRGLALLISGGMTIAGLPPGLHLIADTSFLHVPTLFWIMLAFGFISHFVLRYMRLGRYLYAIGSNAEAASRVGISVTRATLFAYSVSALLATVGGMLLVARLTMGTPTAASGYELQAIAAAVVGGASLFGGRGTIVGCFIGALLFTMIGNGANLLGVDPFWEMVIEGLLIALVVYVDNIQKRRQSGQR